MQLPGRLAASTLGDLLGVLHRGKTTGLLELTEIPGSMLGSVAGRKHGIHLFCGLVAGVETSLHTRPLGEILYDKGLLDPHALVALMRHLAVRDGRLAGEILVEEGLAPKVSVDAGLRAQLRGKLDRLFLLGDANVSFHTARPLPDAARRMGLLGSREFLYGRPRARDREWAPPSSRTSSAQHGEPSERRVSPNRPWSSRNAYGSETSSAASSAAGSASSPRIAIVDASRERALRTLGLQVDPSVDEKTIRQAFRKLAVELHPDKFATAPADKRAAKSARFAEVSAAYHLLVA